VLQYPLLRLAERWLRPMPILTLGVALMALGLGAVALAGSVAGLVVCVSIFTVGTLLATPTQQSVAASLADQRALGSYFGVNALALAFGGSLGNLSGGLLTDAARQIGVPALPWMVFASLGLASAFGLALLGRQLVRRRATAHLVRA
jgi:DHA1 family multidrug resistance protein-like MFS transporter